MHQARPARAPTAHPDSIRIVAMAAAISLNVALLLMALQPMGPRLIRLTQSPDLTVRWLTPPAPVQPPPPVALPQVRLSTPRLEIIRPTPPAPALDIVTPVSQPAPAIAAVPPSPAVVPTSNATTPHAAVVTARLATLAAPPPRYPAQARREHMQGTVILRVLVDAQGRPQQVLVQSGSGHRLLDRTAQQQVLAHWRFKPAVVDGHAVPAWALVPVQFSLRDL